MGLLLRSLSMLLLLLWILFLPELIAQSQGPRSLDALLQDYAYRAFVQRPRTGTSYDGSVPSNLTGIRISAMRLRSGSLRTKGVISYKEFVIPPGVAVQPYVERLVLVYQNLGNWSLVYYPLPGYTYLTPVLGLLAFDAINLTATNLPELDLSALQNPILVKFPDVKSVTDAKCVWFDLHGLPEFSNLVSGNTCSTVQQGHFSIVVESSTAPPSPTPVAAPPLSPPPHAIGEGNKDKWKVWKIVVSVLGGFVILVLLGLLIFWVQRYKHRKKMLQMEKAADVGESLQMMSIRDTRAPVATVTRTQPVLENEYVP